MQSRAQLKWREMLGDELIVLKQHVWALTAFGFILFFLNQVSSNTMAKYGQCGYGKGNFFTY